MKILFATDNLFRNETNIALFERLHKVDPSTQEVALFVAFPFGELKANIPAYVKMVKKGNLCGDYDAVAVFGIGNAERIVVKKLFDLTGDGSESLQVEEADLFIFNDDFIKADTNNKYKYKIDKFNHIFTKNFPLKSSFLRCFPALADRTFILPATIMEERRKRLSSARGGFEGFEGMRLVTVGDLDFSSNTNLIIETAKILKERSFYFEWFIVGRGLLRRKLEKAIMRNGLSDCVRIINKKNPYPYIAESDIFVDVSKRETVIDMAKEALLMDNGVVAIDCHGDSNRFRYYDMAMLVVERAEVMADAIEYMMMELDCDE